MLVGKPKGKRQLEIPKSRFEDNNEITLGGTVLKV
jgi:hypothetical protein